MGYFLFPLLNTSTAKKTYTKWKATAIEMKLSLGTESRQNLMKVI